MPEPIPPHAVIQASTLPTQTPMAVLAAAAPDGTRKVALQAGGLVYLVEDPEKLAANLLAVAEKLKHPPIIVPTVGLRPNGAQGPAMPYPRPGRRL